ncbi:acyl-CoA thioesterase [Melghirimyces profundicolus]|uniref:Acyl-CoA thioesterase n=1 Tax=Melghirimyces profundicolus TaxID=1242148 RepID=A0A2T6BH31_9BACL|nr:hotdog fold thioesterase [Melghirimyces profundicolus]PTX55362.1 acyl-CoA thioesterase [Melghirimyces profundicolus]
MASDEQNPLTESLMDRFRNDPYAKRMGFELTDAAPGFARASVLLTGELFNFAGTPHGGLIFSLADYAFAVASNSHGRVALATQVSVQFMAAARKGERLTAEARETHRTHRAGFYEMRVNTDDSRLIARFLGVVHRLERPVVEGEPGESNNALL